MRYNITASFESNFRKFLPPFPPSFPPIEVPKSLTLLSFCVAKVVYHYTIPYLLALAHPTSTWTICTGAQGDFGLRPVAGIPQGALFSMCVSAARENLETNVRFNELYLAFRVEVDEDAKLHGVVSASEFAKVYEAILAKEEVRSARVRLDDVKDMDVLRFERRF